MRLFTINTLLLLIASIAIITSTSFGIERDESWLIIPGVKAGPITSSSSEADLIRIYGKENISSEVFTDDEGMESEVGTVIYANDTAKMIKILWNDSQKKKYPKALILTGNKSLWKTPDGLSLGTSLKELEKLNDGPFTFWGFAWDAGGSIKSWEKGKLEIKYSQILFIRLNVPNLSMTTHREFVGDRVLSSNAAPVQKLNPFVEEIRISFK